MNKDLQKIIEFIESDKTLSGPDKKALLNSVKSVDDELEVTSFKLQRTEKVKKTTSILLEETIEELEQKRKIVEEQVREAQIEAALERVRARTMAMHKSSELSEAGNMVFQQMKQLGIEAESSWFWFIDTETDSIEIWTTHENKLAESVTVTGDDLWTFNRELEAWKNNESFFKLAMPKDEAKVALKKIFAIELNDNDQANHLNLLQTRHKYGFLGLGTWDEATEEEMNICARFANVFEQTYTRFLDLKQAEAQAREAQIEAALEKIRARTMAMQKSDELAETAYVLYEQLGMLGENPEQLTIGIIDETNKIWEFWLTLGGNQIDHVFKAPINEPILLNKSYEAWKEQKKTLVVDISGDDLKTYYDFYKNLPGYKDFNEFKKSQLPEQRRVVNMAFFSNGSLSLSSPEPKPAETIELLERFAGVLEQTYTRFLDLKQAEAQAREAQIEAALERVRARSMAMHKSSELAEVVAVLYNQMEPLGLATWGCEVILGDDENNILEYWHSSRNQSVLPESYHVPRKLNPVFEKQWDAWKKRTPSLIIELRNNEKREFDLQLFEGSDFKKLPAKIKEDILSQSQVVFSHVSMKYGLLEAVDNKPLTNENLFLLDRFAKVFEQSYTRFLDLQRAESQAREAQIEAALERVRAKAMAMHSSEDLALTVDLFFNELKTLDVTPRRCGVGVVDPATRIVDITSTSATETKGDDLKLTGSLRLSDHPVLDKIYETWEKQGEYFPVIKGNEIKEYYQVMNPQIEFPNFSSDEIQYGYYFFFKEGGVFAWTDKELLEEDINIFRRFKSVLSLTYRRYMDLIEAEVQAREAQIEASLERVRSRAMAMQNSDELREVVTVVFRELQQLGMDTSMCMILIADEDTGGYEWWSTGFTEEELPRSYKIPPLEEFFEHPLAKWWAESRSKRIEYDYFELSGEVKQRWDKFLFEHTELKNMPDENKKWMMSYEKVILCDAFMSRGSLELSCPEPLDDDKAGILKRFAKVIDLTYTRVEDLQQAEARAADALRQASLDRVRAEIASMRSTDDLQRITPVIWRELTTLGVPFIRCGVFLIDEEAGISRVYLSTPSGESLAALELKLDQTDLIQQTFLHWKEGKLYKEHWDREQFIAWTQTMLKLGQIESQEKYQAGKEAPDSLHLQMFPFQQGVVYVGSTSQLSDEEIDLTQKLTDAFGVAYSRYDDFQQLEAAHNELDQLSKVLQRENDRKAEELEEARQLQLAMLPTELPQADNFDIAVYMKTATEVGGDYYDFSVKEDGTLNIGLGDATGHGMKAGTLVSMMKSLFTGNSVNTDIEEFFVTTNSALKNSALGRMMFAFAMINVNRSKVAFINAGMPPIYFYNADKKNVNEISVHGLPLGAMKKITYECNVLTVAKDDVILMITDGLPELNNTENEMYGYDRLKSTFEANAGKSADEIINVLKEEGTGWGGNKDPDDDVSFIVVKFK